MRGKRVISLILTILITLGFSQRALAETNWQGIGEGAKSLMHTTLINKDSIEGIEGDKESETKLEEELEIGKKLSIENIIKYANNEAFISWTNMEGATYELSVNDEIVEVDKNFISYRQLSNKNYTYKVRYKLNDKYSLWSDERSFII